VTNIGDEQAVELMVERVQCAMPHDQRPRGAPLFTQPRRIYLLRSWTSVLRSSPKLQATYAPSVSLVTFK
jgi:hypothetical protein